MYEGRRKMRSNALMKYLREASKAVEVEGLP